MTTLMRSRPCRAPRRLAYLRDRWIHLVVRFANLYHRAPEAERAWAADQAARAVAYDAQVRRHAIFTNSSAEVDWLLCAAT